MRVRIPTPLRSYTGDRSAVEAEGVATHDRDAERLAGAIVTTVEQGGAYRPWNPAQRGPRQAPWQQLCPVLA